jgi:hypothetical protein
LEEVAEVEVAEAGEVVEEEAEVVAGEAQAQVQEQVALPKQDRG